MALLHGRSQKTLYFELHEFYINSVSIIREDLGVVFKAANYGLWILKFSTL